MHRALYLTAILAHAALAQASFEVASIKPDPFNGTAGRIGISFSGDTLRVEHQSLAEMVTFAYGIDDFQLSGGPAWAYAGPMDAGAYQVIAKAGGPAPEKAQFQEMVKTLLAERFQLKVHRETKVFPCYELSIAKNGPKLSEPSDPNAHTVWDGGVVSRYHGKNVSMQDLVFMLRTQSGRPLIDKTGLAGKYDFELTWAAGNPPPPQVTAPSIFTAVQEQLGLKLDSAKASFDTIVIDSAEKPTPN